MKLNVFAPNIHTGGGLILLKCLLEDWPHESDSIIWIDVRARGRLRLPPNCIVNWVMPTIFSRLQAELSLSRSCSLSDKVLLVHNLPPLLPLKARIIVFVQNRNLISDINYSSFTVKTRIRLFFERVWMRLFRHRVNTYFVQTPSMAGLLKDWGGQGHVDVRISPFAPSLPSISEKLHKEWDFLYVSDGEAHKNHKALVQAWKILALRGFFPSLALTLTERDFELKLWIEDQKNSYGLRITNLGLLPHVELLEIYNKVGALIFPSISESFGLPLVEANSLKLPILAGELDFVRDVCNPVETFDPKSEISIARAVLRFLGAPCDSVKFITARDFVKMVDSIV